MIRVICNASTMIHNASDPLDNLIQLLGTHMLCPLHEEFHCYKSSKANGLWHLSGNFENLSHAFRLVTDEQNTIEEIERLAASNMMRNDYQKAAFKLYQDHLVLRTPTHHLMLNSAEVDKWQKGFPSARVRRMEELLIDAEVVGFRFSAEQRTVLAA